VANSHLGFHMAGGLRVRPPRTHNPPTYTKYKRNQTIREEVIHNLANFRRHCVTWPWAPSPWTSGVTWVELCIKCERNRG